MARPINYAARRAADAQPNMTTQGIQALQEITSGRPITAQPMYLPEILREVAERIELEHLAHTLRSLGVEATAPKFERQGVWPLFIGFGLIRAGESEDYAVNAEFARRMIDRIRSGLTAAETARRTVDPDQPVRTAAEDRRLAAEIDRETARSHG